MPSCADTRAYSPRCRSADVLISAAQVSLSGLAKNALDLRDSNPINLCHLGDRHAVFHPRADAGKLRTWNLDRRRREGDCAVCDSSGKTGTSGEIIGSTRSLRAAVGPTCEADGVPHDQAEQACRCLF